MLDRQGLHLRAALFAAIRDFFTSRGFLEVDTPLRQPVTIPESNIVPLIAEGQYLQTSPELCMKRILAAGCDKIFQLCPCFRKGERGRLHLEEFMMLEWYRRDADYHQLMDDCECLLNEIVAGMVAESTGTAPGGEDGALGRFELARPWPRLSVDEAFRRYSPLSLERSMADDCFEEMLVEHVEPKLGCGKPLFLYDYPVEMAALARKKPGDPTRAERFELYLHGVELANGYSELTDAGEQRQRFAAELGRMEKMGLVHGGMPERFLADLERLPAAAGIALGVDRLFMLLAGYGEIGRAVPFGPEDF